MVRAAVAVVAALLVGCSVPELSLEGKRCPCAEGFVCDPARDVCVRSAASDASVDVSGDVSGEVSGDAANDAPIADGDAPGKIVVSDLAVAWTTANSVRWTWARTGDESEFGSFELVTGPTAADVASRTAASRTFTAKENPELGSFFLRRTTGLDPVVSTITDEHAPNADVYGQLVAFDNAGHVTKTAIVKARTIDAIEESILFRDSLPSPGYVLPASASLSTEAPAEGAKCLAWDVTCPDAGASCYEIVRYQDASIPVTPLTEGSFGGAFLEMKVAVASASPSYYSELWLGIGASTCTSPCAYKYDYYTMRPDGTYRTIQIPLRALDRKGTPLDRQAMVDGGWVARAFGFGGNFTTGGRVRIDAVKIRW